MIIILEKHPGYSGNVQGPHGNYLEWWKGGFGIFNDEEGFIWKRVIEGKGS